MRVFNEIRKIKPRKLYVVSDGPRENRPGEKEACIDAKKIIESVDWECEVFKNYSEINLGCKKRVSSGIDWFFENEEEGIILEDDCLPNQSFFNFCEEMLDKYRDNEKIGMISGNNFQFGKIKNEYSYYFSRYAHIWGWATWRRVWNKYDVDISSWPKIKETSGLKKVFNNYRDNLYWSSIFNDVYNNKIDTWDYQWSYTLFTNNYLSVMPSVNLVSNIGFGENGSTHTKRISKFSNIPTVEIPFPLKEPAEIVRDSISDDIVQKENFPFFRFFIRKFLKLLKII
ncbi:MAG: glycosyltransferase family 2 protein [bacterium]